MPAEQSADASGPTWNWRLPRALPVTSPASCHGGASRAKYPTEPSQNSWRMVAQPAVAPGFPRHPGQCAWPPGAGRPPPFGPLPSPGSYGLRGAAGSGGSCGFGICANLRNSSTPPKTGPAPVGPDMGDPHETRGAAHSASTVHPIHDVQPDHWRADTSPGPSPFLAFRGPVSRIPMPADPAGDKI